MSENRYAASLRRGVCLLVVAMPIPAGAQEVEAEVATVTESEVSALLGTMDPGSWLRVAWGGGQNYFGALKSTEDTDMLDLEYRSETVGIPYAQIDSLWVRSSRTGEGAALGGVIGAAAGALFVFGVNRAICDAPGGCSGPASAGWVIGLGGGGLLGAAIGAGVGSSSLVWDLALPAAGPTAPPASGSSPSDTRTPRLPRRNP